MALRGIVVNGASVNQVPVRLSAAASSVVANFNNAVAVPGTPPPPQPPPPLPPPTATLLNPIFAENIQDVSRIIFHRQGETRDLMVPDLIIPTVRRGKSPNELAI